MSMYDHTAGSARAIMPPLAKPSDSGREMTATERLFQNMAELHARLVSANNRLEERVNTIFGCIPQASGKEAVEPEPGTIAGKMEQGMALLHRQVAQIEGHLDRLAAL